MKVLLKATFSGPSVFWASGSVQELPEKEAKNLIAHGYAEEYTEETPEETEEAQQVKPVERAEAKAPKVAERRGKRKKR